MNAVVEAYGKGTPMQAAAHPEIEAFVYSPFPAKETAAWIRTARLDAIAADPLPLQFGPAATPPTTDDSTRAEFERKIEEESRRSFEAGREQGHLEGVHAEREAQTATRSIEEKRRTEQIAALLKKFDEERDQYLHSVEHEVVKLALAIAARILRREAQMDPLLLTGAVRVALGQLSNTTQVRLRVPPADLDLWTEAIEHVPNLAVKPTVLAREDMRLGDCVIETELGSVDLGIRSQLGEIERGFFDRAGRSGTGLSDEISAKNHDQKAQR